MDHAGPRAAAYGRLLSQLSRRLGADHAELLLRRDPPPGERVIAQYGIPAPATGDHTWLELPFAQDEAEVGRLRLAFAPAVAPPGEAALNVAQALVELAGLLAAEHHALTQGLTRQAGRRILAVTEEELQRIILDIHDGPVQKLFVVSARLSLLQAQLTHSPDAIVPALEPALAQLSSLVGSALQEIKNTLSTFRPAEFQRRLLPAVLQGLVLQHAALTGHQVALRIVGDIPPVSLPVKIALYRVLQEALANAYRHAGVDHQEVVLRGRREWVEIEVVDQGRGFTPPPLDGPDATEREEHIGLRGMRERMHLVGGQLRLVSRPGSGTRVVVRVPSDA